MGVAEPQGVPKRVRGRFGCDDTFKGVPSLVGDFTIQVIRVTGLLASIAVILYYLF